MFGYIVKIVSVIALATSMIAQYCSMCRYHEDDDICGVMRCGVVIIADAIMLLVVKP